MNRPSLPHLGHNAEPVTDSGLNVFTTAHRLLRGRYHWALLLAGILGPLGFLAGYNALPAVYESKAMIQVAPVLPKILYESEENSMIPMFGAFVETQASLITSHRVRDMAMQSPAWKDIHQGDTATDIGAFEENLAVTRPSDSQVIVVAYRDEDPKRAQAISKAVVDSYMSIYGEQNRDTETQRFQVLEERVKALNSEIEGVQTQIFEIAHEYGSDSLDTVFEHKVAELQKTETELEAAKLQLANLEASAKSGGAGNLAELSIDQIAALDRQMQLLIAERNNAKVQVEGLATTYANPEQRLDYRRAKKELEIREAEVQEYARAFRETARSGLSGGRAVIDGATVTPLPVATDPQSAKERVTRIQELYDEARESTLELGRKNLKIKELRGKLANAKDRLEKTENRMEQLSVENVVGGRITLLSEAELPTLPANSSRLKQFAVLGGLAGSGLGVGAILLLGLIRPRFRYIADAEIQQPSLLGALPDLPEESPDVAQSLMAAQCVHQIRMVLQPRVPQERPPVITITSAVPGSGKTSLTLALALSFAASGTSTLVIDGDLTGMGLTRRTREALGRKRSALLLDGTVAGEAALADASLLGQRPELVFEENTGDTNGHGPCPEQDAQSSNASAYGLVDALLGRPVDECLQHLDVLNLSILPARGSTETPLNIVAQNAMSSLIEELREHYDTILIDSGPIPGPMDSSVMACTADRVVMVASRGEQLSQVRQAIEHLELIQVPLAGLVFNRARNRDLEQSRHSSAASSNYSSYSKGERCGGNAPEDPNRTDFTRFGPLAQAVWAMAGIGSSAGPRNL